MHALRSTQAFVQELWRLLAPYWSGESGSRARPLLILLTLAALTVGLVTGAVSYANRVFMDGLAARSGSGIMTGVLILVGAILLNCLVGFARSHLRLAATFGWRKALTAQLAGGFLQGRTPYIIEREGLISHPDQRIEEDCRLAPEESLTLFVSFCGYVSVLIVSAAILWEAAPALPIWLGGFKGYMPVAAILYVVIATWVMRVVAGPLTAAYRESETRSAALRNRLLRVRENVEQVVLGRATTAEQAAVGRHLDEIGENWRKVRKYTARSDLVQAIGIGPVASTGIMAAMSPFYLSGAISLGQLTQLGMAMGQFIGAAAWFLIFYEHITKVRARMDRLLDLQAVIKAASTRAGGVKVAHSVSGVLETRALALTTPDGRAILAQEDLRLEPGRNVLLWGESGAGKSTLMRALAGIWPWGSGTVCAAGAGALFVPQSLYFPAGQLRAAAQYPEPPAGGDGELKWALEMCQLEHLIPMLDAHEDWGKVLSGGERQRLALVRAFLARPAWLFLDEATSALDARAEHALYENLVRHLPDTTLVSASHREAVRAFHDRIIKIGAPAVAPRQLEVFSI